MAPIQSNMLSKQFLLKAHFFWRSSLQFHFKYSPARMARVAVLLGLVGRGQGLAREVRGEAGWGSPSRGEARPRARPATSAYRELLIIFPAHAFVLFGISAVCVGGLGAPPRPLAGSPSTAGSTSLFKKGHLTCDSRWKQYTDKV